MEWEIVGNPSEDTEKMSPEVSDDHFCGIVAVAARRYQFKLHFVLVLDEVLHCRRDLIVQDVLLRCDVGARELQHKCLICLYHFGVFSALHGLDQDAAAIYFHHDQDIFVTSHGPYWELARMIRENGSSYVIYLDVDITLLFATELVCIARFQWCWFRFCGALFFRVWFICPFSVAVVSG